MNALAAATRPARVVIIDDTADLRDLLKIALSRGGFDVVGEAGDGEQGIEVVRLHTPDVVLLDLAMPVMDGIEALPHIRRLCPQGKIVVLSGFGAQHMSERAIKAGADGYVQKGVPLNVILDYIREVREGTRSQAQALPVALANPPATPGNLAAWQILEVAPYGVVELADEPLLPIVHANPMGARLLGTSKTGTPLGTVAAELAALVSCHRLEVDASFESDLDGGRVRATMRRTGRSILVFLDSASDDVGLLRRAIATTAHEVRGPVAVLCGIAETLAWDGDDMTDAQQDRLMTAVARQAKILDQITADLLTAAQIQHGTLRVDLQVVEPRLVVQSIVESRFDVEVAYDDLRCVRADPLRLEQILTNLLSNAHKYGAAPYLVRVRPSTDQTDHVCIDVVDHGEGVPAEFRDHLFREFSRAQAAATTGVGLGLFVVRTLAQAQQGNVSYAPGAEGGSVFTITLCADDTAA